MLELKYREEKGIQESEVVSKMLGSWPCVNEGVG